MHHKTKKTNSTIEVMDNERHTETYTGVTWIRIENGVLILQPGKHKKRPRDIIAVYNAKSWHSFKEIV